MIASGVFDVGDSPESGWIVGKLPLCGTGAIAAASHSVAANKLNDCAPNSQPLRAKWSLVIEAEGEAIWCA